MENRFVYADNAATTPSDRRVLDKMLPFQYPVSAGQEQPLGIGRSSQGNCTDPERRPQ